MLSVWVLDVSVMYVLLMLSVWVWVMMMWVIDVCWRSNRCVEVWFTHILLTYHLQICQIILSNILQICSSERPCTSYSTLFDPLDLPRARHFNDSCSAKCYCSLAARPFSSYLSALDPSLVPRGDLGSSYFAKWPCCQLTLDSEIRSVVPSS